MQKEETTKLSAADLEVRQFHVTLPVLLAEYVEAVTGKGAPHETPSEFIRDMVRSHMEQHLEEDRQEIHDMLAKSMQESKFVPWTDADMEDVRKAAGG